MMMSGEVRFLFCQFVSQNLDKLSFRSLFVDFLEFLCKNVSSAGK